MDTAEIDGCMLCGEDFAVGERIRVWTSARGDVACHDDCYIGLDDDSERRARRYPRITAAAVTVYDDRASFSNRQPGAVATFAALAPGDEFFLSAYSRSGLLADLDKPGAVLYVKLSTRVYKRCDNDQVTRIGRTSCKVWQVAR